MDYYTEGQKKDINNILDKFVNTHSLIKKSKVDEFKRENGLLDEALEVGVWYKINNGIACFQKGNTRECIHYGFRNNMWGTWHMCPNTMYNGIIKTTHQEVKDALAKHWEKDNEGFECYRLFENIMYGYNTDGNGGVLLFENGTWFPIARTVEEKKVAKVPTANASDERGFNPYALRDLDTALEELESAVGNVDFHPETKIAPIKAIMEIRMQLEKLKQPPVDKVEVIKNTLIDLQMKSFNMGQVTNKKKNLIEKEIANTIKTLNALNQ